MAIIDRYRWVHMVGIGGAGMAALARFLKAQGMRVTGSDIASSSTVSGLAREGFSIGKGHCAT